MASFHLFDTSSVGTLFLTWVLLLVPLALGPNSLIRSLMVAFFVATLFNLILFVRAVTLPNAGVGINDHFYHSQITQRLSSSSCWDRMKSGLMGNWFLTSWGCLIFVGKHVDKNKFALPYVFFSGLAFYVTLTLNTLKFGGFFGFYHELLQLDRLTYQQRERIWSFQWRFESWWHRGDDLTHIPLLLSQLPGSNFWLFLHFSFHLCASLSSSAIILETIASSLAELLPNAWSDRTKLSKNLPLTGALCLLGFGVSTAIKYYYSLGEDNVIMIPDFHHTAGDSFTVIFPIAFLFISATIAPLTLSRVFNSSHHQDLVSFVLRQTSSIRIPSALIKTLLLVGMLVGGFLAAVSIRDIAGLLRHRLLHSDYDMWFLVFMCVMAFIIFLVFIVKILLHVRNHKGHPFCIPIGQSLQSGEGLDTAAESMELKSDILT